MKKLRAAKTAIDHSQFEAGQDLDGMRLQFEGARKSTDLSIEQSRADSELRIQQMRIESMERMDLMEEEAREQEKQQNKRVDDKLASIPSESTVNE